MWEVRRSCAGQDPGFSPRSGPGCDVIMRTDPITLVSYVTTRCRCEGRLCNDVSPSTLLGQLYRHAKNKIYMPLSAHIKRLDLDNKIIHYISSATFNMNKQLFSTHLMFCLASSSHTANPILFLDVSMKVQKKLYC